jgi:hypothetical protein
MSPADIEDDPLIMHQLNRLLATARRLGWGTAAPAPRVDQTELLAVLADLAVLLRVMRWRASDLKRALSAMQVNARANIAYRSASHLVPTAHKQ